MRTIAIVVAIIASAAPASSQIYTWTDANGAKHYSNTAPPQNSQSIETKDEIEHDAAAVRTDDFKEKAFWRDVRLQNRLDDADRQAKRSQAKLQDRFKEIDREVEKAKKDSELQRAKREYEYLKSRRDEYMRNLNETRTGSYRQYWREKIDSIDEARRKLVNLENQR